MCSRFDGVLQKEILDILPKELERIHLFGVIAFSYEELMKAHSLGLIKYTYDAKKGHMKIDQRNYSKKEKSLKAAYEEILPTLTNEPKQVIPRHPNEIAKRIYDELIRYNHSHNTNLITKKVIGDTLLALMGIERLPSFTPEERFRNAFLSFTVEVQDEW